MCLHFFEVGLRSFYFMDRNSIIGLLLIVAIMIGYTVWVSPSKEELEKEKLRRDSIEAVNAQKAIQDSIKKSRPSEAIADTSMLNSVQMDSVQLAEKTFQTFENDLIKLKICNYGASIKSVELKKFKTFEGKPVVLLQPDSSELSFKIPFKNSVVNSSELIFENVSTKNQISGDDSITITYRYSKDNQYIDYIYVLKGNSYLIDFKLDMSKASGLISPIAKTMDVNWLALTNRQEKNIENERNNTTVYYRTTDGDVDRINPMSYDSEKLEKPLQWIAFKEQFFSSVLISKSGFSTGTEVKTTEVTIDTLNKRLSANSTVSLDATKLNSVDFSFYFGPSHYKTLKQLDLALEKQIPLGWGIFGWVNRFIVIPVFNFLDGFNLSYGIVILVLTLVIKLLLFPLQYRSYLSQAKMRVLKPEIDELSKRFSSSEALQKQQAMMELYKKAGVNPLGGCVPLLFQMPILFAMFSFFPAAIELRQESFLWATDLSTYDSVFNLPFRIPGYGSHVSLFALLMTISTIIYTRMNQQLSAQNEQMAQLKWLMYLMPVIFLFVLNSYPSGLNYYYFLANVITFGQQFLFTRFVDEKKIRAIIDENKKNPKASKKSAFQLRLEEMAKKQQQLKNKK